MSKTPPKILGHSPTYWFTVLTWALHDSDLQRAAEAQEQLRLLGLEVRLVNQKSDRQSTDGKQPEGEVSL